MKPDVSHLRAFGAPCAIVEPKERLRKLDDRASMCFFIGYKYEGGGYRVWDPKRRVVVESKDIVFFEDGLPPPTLNEARLQQNDADEPVAQPAPDHILEPPTPPDVPPTPQPTTTPHIAEATPDPAPDLTTTSDPTPQPRIVVRLPGRWMNRPDAHPAQAHGDSSARNDDDESEQDESDEEANAPTRPVHDVSYVPDFPVRTTRSGLKRDGGGGGSTMLVLDEAVHPPIAFSAGLPAGFSSRGCPIPATCVRRWPLPTPKAGRRPWTEK